MSVDYRPPPTIEAFMRDDSLVRVVVGPIGSGKTMGCIMELLRRATQQAPSVGTNIRHTRFAIVRNTLQQLRTTVLPDVQQYLGPLTTYFVTDSTIRIRAPIGDGTVIHSDWIMIPLDTKEDQRRLLSMQLTGAWICELREVPIDVVSALLGRLGRYPSKIMGGPTFFGLVCDTNPWSTDSPFHEALVLNPTPNWKLFHQPSGISPQAENTENLPPGYYDNLSSGRDEDWAAVHVESQWGVSNAGQAVFRRSFHAPTHVRDIAPVVNPGRPLLVGLDFGRTPTALICQVDVFGRLIIFEEVVTEDCGLHQMLGEYLKPKLLSDPYAGKRVFVVADPAGAQKSQLSEETAFDVLREHGLLAYPAATNAIGPRLSSVERLLRNQIMGEPALQISRSGCPQLIRALGNTYRYRRKRDGQLEDIPEKLHPASDLCFVAGTLITTPNGAVPVEGLQAGDLVETHLGPRVVVATGARDVTETVVIDLSDGTQLRCTPEHPFAVDMNWIRADSLQHNDILETVGCAGSEARTFRSSLAPATTGTERTATIGEKPPSLNSYGSAITAPFRRVWRSITRTAIGPTTLSAILSCLRPFRTWNSSAKNSAPPADAPGGQRNSRGGSVQFRSMLRSGRTPMATFRLVLRSITGTKIQPTTPSAISSWLRNLITPGITPGFALPAARSGLLPPAHWLLPLRGMPALPVQPSIRTTAKSFGLMPSNLPSPASGAVTPTRPTPICASAVSAACPASSKPATLPASMTKPGSVWNAAARSPSTNTSGLDAAQRVVRVRFLVERVAVFNLQVDDAHTYYAGGVLVHNCDCVQYAAMGVAADISGRVMRRDAPRPQRAKVSSAGWT